MRFIYSNTVKNTNICSLNLLFMKVSIITVAYNSVRTLPDTIVSVLNQTYPNIEYIIVDGGSTDGTLDIILNFENKFCNRMKWISEKDHGIYDAMNKGIRMATGDVVGILNSDDYFTDDRVIEKVCNTFTKYHVDAVYGDIHFVDNKNSNKVVRYYSSKRFRPFWLRFGFMPAHPSFYIKKQVMSEVGGYRLDYKIGSDFEMMVRLFRKHNISYKYLNLDFVTMRVGGVSTKNLKSKLVLIKEDVRACLENGIYTNKFFEYVLI